MVVHYAGRLCTDQIKREKDALDGAEQQLFTSASYLAAPPAVQAEMAKPLKQRRAEFNAKARALVRPYVEREARAYADALAARLDAAAANPRRALDLEDLVGRLGEAEQARLARTAIAENDLIASFALMRKAASPAIAELAAEVGAKGLRQRLQLLMAAKQEWALTVALTTDDPTEVVAAANEARMLDLGNGTSKSCSDRELEVLLRDEDA